MRRKLFGTTLLCLIIGCMLVTGCSERKKNLVEAVNNKDDIGLALYTIVQNATYKDGVLFYLSNKFSFSLFERITLTERHYSWGKEWLRDIGKSDTFSKTTDLVLRQLLDLSRRMDSIYNSKAHLTRKYDADSISKEIKVFDKDIKHLSELGWRLVTATKSFFESAKKTMIKLDIASARQEALDGLKSFNQDIEKIRTMQLKAVDQSINMVVEAMENLEKAVNR